MCWKGGSIMCIVYCGCFRLLSFDIAVLRVLNNVRAMKLRFIMLALLVVVVENTENMA